MTNENSGFNDVSYSPDRVMTYLEAIREGLRSAMSADEAVCVLGEDIGGDFGGAFKVTAGLAEEFGDARVRNTPLAELSFVGMATGMALMGLKPVIEMQFADFISTAFDSIVQFAATNHYRWGAPVPWVIRAPSDGGISSGPFHSQNPEAWFVHTPGLKVVAPGTPADAKGLLLAAIADPNPVIYFESKPLYRSLKGEVPEAPEPVPIGVANVIREGSDVSIITYGTQVQESLTAAAELEEEGYDVEVLDLRTVKPLDWDAVFTTVEKTGKVLVVHSANRLVGVGGEVVAEISERCFDALDAAPVRLGALDTPAPFSPPLEEAYRPSARKIADAARTLARY